MAVEKGLGSRRMPKSSAEAWKWEEGGAEREEAGGIGGSRSVEGEGEKEERSFAKISMNSRFLTPHRVGMKSSKVHKYLSISRSPLSNAQNRIRLLTLAG